MKLLNPPQSPEFILMRLEMPETCCVYFDVFTGEKVRGHVGPMKVVEMPVFIRRDKTLTNPPDDV